LYDYKKFLGYGKMEMIYDKIDNDES